ncbi:ABC transporter ATP-binding protein [Hymenobacter busanensis]|uniref:ABC transporter ATP-binding protein n=1 Tax=Hymenobacter busanensis TaxID=2607656 RepID=A0A7L4ZX71_9BACT|nr:ABC transporter ATP-binding protein [Hymenobacter busanensis]KAA9332227.1 ABC transporter ATP-binding protein [Hymenobacter busanensis]QHJ07435.1 ATP-binding cassette domain-containing protein [Hymenobacter busanensis]
MSFWTNLFESISAKRPRPEGKPAVSLRERFSALRNLPEFLRLIWQTSPALTLGNVALRLLRAALPVAMLYVAQLLLDSVVHLSQLPAEQRPANLMPASGYAALEFGLAILSDLLGRGTALLDSLLGDLFANRTSVRLMEHAAELDLDQFEDSTFYDKLERARRQTLSRTVLMAQVLSQAQDVITMAFLAVGLAAFNPWLLLLLLVAVVPAFLGESHFNERSYSLVHGWTPERRELDYLRQTGASDETAKEVKIFGLSRFLIDRFRQLSDEFYQKNKDLVIRRAGWGSFFAAVGAAGYYAAYVYIIRQAVLGQVSIGQLTFLAGSFARMRGLLEGILSRFSSVADGALYLQDFFDFFALRPRIVRQELTGERPIPFPRPIRQGFQFENVGFQYKNGAKWALRNLNFMLKAGEKLALVGENGAGKTTLVKLLARLYDPTEGRILLDGYDLREYDPAELRQEIGVIFQDFVRFQLPAGQNIAVGRIDERQNQDRIEGAAARSLADSVIAKLPQGYEQMIGRRFAGGVDLSGGEWQKIALGRAYMRDAQLLILDEPTAALDARAEYEVFQRFKELTQGKTAVLISHRFSTVRMADRILVIENGQLQELGSHEELLAKGGRYAELFQLQAAGYR